MTTASVSVLMPTFEYASFIPRALESLLAQTFTEWEVLVVDDGSTDGTEAVVARYQKAHDRIVAAPSYRA